MVQNQTAQELEKRMDELARKYAESHGEDIKAELSELSRESSSLTSFTRFSHDCPIILITGYLSAMSGAIILDEVAEVLAKPFDLNVLRSTVRRLFDTTPHATN
jgi:hypothetical protein